MALQTRRTKSKRGAHLAKLAALGIALTATAACTQKILETRSATNLASTSDAQFNGLYYALPRGLISLTASWDGKAAKGPQITAPSVTVLPDERFRYALLAVPSPFANDALTLQSTNGLLTSVNAVTEDQTSAALTKLIDVGIEAQKAAVSRERGAKAVSAGGAPFNVTVTFDPFDKKSVTRAKKELRAVNFTLTIKDQAGTQFPTNSGAGQSCKSSVCYRVPVQAYVEVRGRGNFESIKSDFAAAVPDQRLIGGYDVRRAACVKQTTELSLTNGTLSKAVIDKPSEVVGCLSIPLDVLKQIVSVPGALLGQRTTDLDAQKGLLTAQENLINAQTSLTAAQTAAIASETGAAE